MLDISIGCKNNALAIDQLIDILSSQELNGTLFIGYPILSDFENRTVIDALLVCQEHGFIVINFDSCSPGEDYENRFREKQDELYRALEVKLKNYRNLVKGRSLSFSINIVTLVPGFSEIISEDDLCVSEIQNLPSLLLKFDAIDLEVVRNINAAIERVTNVKPPRKRTNVQNLNSRGAILREMEKEIYNLDKWQNNATIETPDGVQRIRGLAGSGKTIVLALKAAYLHSLHEDWNIAITFQTRSLYQQFQDLVRRFTWDQIKDEPDWTRLRIIHAWGGANQPGFYSEVAHAQGKKPQDYNYARAKANPNLAFDIVCSELLGEVDEDTFVPIFDAVLIDEAQDFPQSFFKLAYLATKDPKRIIYAYDELQNLSNYTMSPPSILFGSNKLGIPHVPELKNTKNQPSQDIVLPVCYRNTPWALATAHALGFGIYYEQGLVQYFNDPKGLWEEVGYELASGNFHSDQNISLRRRKGSYPEYISRLLKPDDCIQYNLFPDRGAEIKYLAQQIQKDLSENELEYRDILIILPNAYTAKNDAIPILNELNALGIPAHLAGVTSSPNELFNDDAIAISNIFRAKGNEASMVYILDCDYVYEGAELIKRRNIIFTGITRSRGWVRLYGCGSSMEHLIAEINQVIQNNFCLNFKVPNQSELDKMKKLYRDLTPKERENVQKVEGDLASFIDQLERGTISLEILPRELRSKLFDLFKRTEE